MISKFHPFQLSFLIFSMLLNCMGIIILQYSGSHISYNHLGILEFFKDIPIALTSLFCVNYINRFGSKNALVLSLITVLICCSVIPFVDEFWFFKIWFILIGVSFSIAKISIFGLIRNNVNDEQELSKIMNRVEASFMIGLFFINFTFGWLLSSRYNVYWKFGFLPIGLLAFLAILELRRFQYTEVKSENISVFGNMKNMINIRNIIFLTVLFFVVFVEQCFNSWLPTFYKNNLKVNSFYALQSTAFLALFSFIGRFITSKLIRKFSWYHYIMLCLVVLAVLIFAAQLMLNISVSRFLPFLLVIFPMFGLFLSPLYPLYNSKFLFNISKEKVNILTSLIVIFSALGSSFGSLGMSFVFEKNLDQYFLMFILIPLSAIFALTVFFLQKLILRQ